MVNTIAPALRHVKDELPRLIERHVMDYLTQHHHHNWRQRLLDPLTTVMLFILQVMHGNTAINHLRHLSGMTCTAAAYCKARQRIPMALLTHLADGVVRELWPESDEACRWRGHRVWRADATSFSMPDTPELQKHFGQPQQVQGVGFPVATLLTLCNAAGFIVRTLALPLRTHEASQIAKLHPELEEGDVLVYDRGGCSYAQIALLSAKNGHAIFRMHQKQIVSFRPHRKHAAPFQKRHGKGKPKSQWLARLGKYDQRVRWFKPASKPKWMTREQHDALPASQVVRELRYQVRRQGFRTRTITLVTTLLDAQAYPAKELAEQYLQRWDIELNFRHLKTTMGMEVLRCHSVAGVMKELAVFTLVYNLVRLVMLRAAERQRVPINRISFVDALRWLRDARDAQTLQMLIVNPLRRDRIEPRVIKRRMKEYDLMKRPREQLRQELLLRRLAA